MTDEKLEWFPLYVEKFLVGTANMKPHEVGAYIRLLIYQWRKGAIPNDERVIREITGAVRGSLKTILSKFSQIETQQGKSLQQETLEQVRNEQIEKKKKRSLSAKNAADQRWQGDANALRTHCERMPIEEKRIEEKREREEDPPREKFAVMDCFTVALRDTKWVADNKTNPEELASFVNMLTRRSIKKKFIDDFKEHFANWKQTGGLEKEGFKQQSEQKKMIM